MFVFRCIYNTVVLYRMRDANKDAVGYHATDQCEDEPLPLLSSVVRKECQTLPRASSASLRMPCFARE